MNQGTFNGVLQEGIYYEEHNQPKASLGVVFLRVSNSDSHQVGRILANLWKVYANLKKGIVKEAPAQSKNLHSGNLTILIGFGPRIFSIKGIKRQIPIALSAKWTFLDPMPNGGGSIFSGSSLHYAEDVFANHVPSEDIIIQFIGDTQLATHRAIIDTWAFLAENQDEDVLRFSRFYTGFQRPDKRNWMGFHDGISNVKSNERKPVIAIERSPESPSEGWTANGTYLTYMRISIDIVKWNKLSVEEQEILVGREKISGCPIVTIDKNNKPLKDKRCPVPGTIEVTDKGNEGFREHPRYSIGPKDSDSNNILLESHVGSTQKGIDVPSWKKESFRIFRQGFEFLEPADTFPGFRVGLNFISFQNTPERVIGALKDWQIQNSYVQDVRTQQHRMNDYLFVRAGGIFFVPPINTGDVFPGSSIFLDSTDDKTSSLDKMKAKYRQN